MWRNRHQILSRLARQNRVLYVEPRSYLRPTWRQIRNGQFDWHAMRQPWLEPVDANLWVHHTPTWAPRTDRQPLGFFTRLVRNAALRRTMRKIQLQQPLLWLFLPDQGDMIGRFGERLVIYHVVDEYTGYSGVRESLKPVLKQMEIEIMRRADLVFTSSPALYEAKRAYNPYTFHIPNGVDYTAFAQVMDRETAPPDDVAGLPRPIIGYIGSINDKLDLGLLQSVAKRWPNGSVVLVGSVQSHDAGGLSALRAEANVHFLGRKPVELVPHYMKACDICLLPYRMNEWTKHIDALKLYEYLACGKPVVSVDLPTVQPFADLVYVATGRQSFLQVIEEAWQTDTPDLANRRRERVKTETWDRRVGLLSEHIEAALARREGPSG